MDGAATSYVHAKLLGLPTFARELLAGGLAGGFAKTAVAPLERTKIILQTRGGNLTVVGVLQQIWTREGLAGLFRGNTASVLRIVPYAAIHFGSYEYFRRAIVQLATDGSSTRRQQLQHLPLWDLLAGSASGATAVLATYPLDLVRTRQAWATEAPAPGSPGGVLHHHHHRPGIWSLLVSTASEEGVYGLYRGVAPTLLGILPYAGLKFYVYQALKNVYRTWATAAALGSAMPSDQRQQHTTATWQQQQQEEQQQLQEPQQQLQLQQQQRQQHIKPPIAVTLVVGGLAGLVAQTLTYPLDVVRRHMQVQHLRDTAQGASSSHSGGAGRVAATADVASQTQHCSSSGSSSSKIGNRMSSWQSSTSQVQLHSAVPPVLAGAASNTTSRRSSSQQTAAQSLPARAAGMRAGVGEAAVLQQQWRLTHHPVGSSPAHQGPPRLTTLSVARMLVSEGGVRALFRGLSVNYLKVVPSTAIGFSLYDALKSYLGLSGTL